jgi:hypothetical protein
MYLARDPVQRGLGGAIARRLQRPRRSGDKTPSDARDRHEFRVRARLQKLVKRFE